MAIYAGTTTPHMRILVVTPELNEESGGIPVVVKHMLLELANLGLLPVVIHGNRAGQREFPEIRDYVQRGLIREVVVPSSRVPIGYHFSPGLPARVRNENPDIVVIHGHHNWYSDVALVSAIVKRKPIVFFPHGGMSPIMNYSTPKNKIKRLSDSTIGRLYVRYVSAFVSASEFETGELIGLGIPPERVATIPHGVDLPRTPCPDEVSQVRRKFGLRKHHVMYFGRLHWRKGIQYLIRAFKAIERLNGDVTLTISGPDDGMRSSLERLSRDLGLERSIVFTGFLSRPDLLSLVKSADVVVNPSNAECFGFALAEAISMSCPVIQAFDGPRPTTGLPLVKDGVNGYIVRFGDVDGLATRIWAIISNPALRDQLAANSGIVARSFQSWSEVGRTYERFFRSLVQ